MIRDNTAELECTTSDLFDKPQPTAARRIRAVRAPSGPNSIPFTERLSCTISEACAATGLGRTKLYDLIGAGAVETTLVGRRRLVSVRSLVRLIGREPGQSSSG